MFAISNKELEEKKDAGFFKKCSMCNKKHKIEYGTENGVETKIMGFFRCKGKTYLGSLNGKEI